jgi:hypothetical protein
MVTDPSALSDRSSIATRESATGASGVVDGLAKSIDTAGDAEVRPWPTRPRPSSPGESPDRLDVDIVSGIVSCPRPTSRRGDM